MSAIIIFYYFLIEIHSTQGWATTKRLKSYKKKKHKKITT